MSISIARHVRVAAIATLVVGSSAFSALASDVNVRIVNLTSGQFFSPVIAWTHGRSFPPFFTVGQPASDGVRAVAEDGDTSVLKGTLEDDGRVKHIELLGGPIPPGEERTITIDTRHGGRFLSLASMLVNTNDAFVALRSMRIPRRGQTVSFFEPAWDAGTEDNNEDCAYIPGPACVSEPGNEADANDGEGVVFTHAGIHGRSGGIATSDLNPSAYDWRNPVAYIEVTHKR